MATNHCPHSVRGLDTCPICDGCTVDDALTGERFAPGPLGTLEPVAVAPAPAARLEPTEAEIAAAVAKLYSYGVTAPAMVVRAALRAAAATRETAPGTMRAHVWCLPCRSYHVVPRTLDEHTTLQCRGPLPAAAAPAWSARCDCYQDHNSMSGRCNHRDVTDPTRLQGEPARCARCRTNCPTPIGGAS